MGIKGLLPFVERACRPSHVQEFKGKRVAIDVSCLLHRGVFGCVESIAQGLKTDFCMKYVEKYLKVFFHFDCEIFLIFDGKRLQAKQIVNDERKGKRDSIKRTGEELMSVGLENEAYKVFRQGIGVPKEIQEDAITYFASLNTVKVIVSPYEADAQMAFMIQNDIVDVVVTEDSDLIVFGASKIIFKLKENGACLLFEQAKLRRCLCPALAKNFKLETFRRMCIMSGCDYLPSGLSGVGLKKAEAVLSKTSITDIKILLRRVPSLLNNRSIKITPELIESFMQAENTFMYQIVYDPLMKCQRPVNFYPGTVEEDYSHYTSSMLEIANQYKFAGTIASPSEAEQMSKGIHKDSVEYFESCTQKISTSKTPVLTSSHTLNININSQSPKLVSPKISTLKLPFRPSSQPLQTAPSSVNYNIKRSRSSGMFSPKVTKRRITIHEKGGITFNVTGSSEVSSSSNSSKETDTNPVKEEKIDLSKINAKKIVNPSLSVSYTKINITNFNVNRRFVSPLVRRSFVAGSLAKPVTPPAFL